MKIGVTSQNYRTITGHAGKARRFLIFATDPTSGEVKEIERLDLPQEMSMHYFSGGPHPIDQVDVLITGGCGAGFMRNMEMRGIKVITTSATDPIQSAQAVLNGEPLPAVAPESNSQQVTFTL